MDQAMSEMVAFNLEHRVVSGISMEHTFGCYVTTGGLLQ